MPNKLTRLAVLAVGVAIVCVGWSVSRRFVASGITSRALKNPATSRAAVSELSQLGDSALPSLLDAAVSDDREVAIPARAEVEALLSRWAVSAPSSFEDRCLRVIAAVSEREPLLTPSGRVWARRLGDHALRLLDQHRSGSGSELLTSIETLFTLSEQPSQYPDQPLRPRNLQPVAVAEPHVNDVTPNPSSSQKPPADPTPQREPATLAPAVSPPPQIVEVQPTPERDEPPSPAPERPAAVATGPSALDWRQPARDHAEPEEPRKLADDATSSGPTQVAVAPLADDAQQSGFSSEVTQVLKGDARGKLQLVEQLLRGQHKNAASILLRLAKDPSPRVRLSAISALGTSPNPLLTEAAYRLAMHDEDPKVARLASELQKLLR